MRNSKNICIVGAGFGGLQTALRLEKKLSRLNKTAVDGWTIYLIDKQEFHLYTPLLYEAATGFFEEETPKCEGILRKGLCLNLEGIKEIIGKREIKYVNEEVVSVDTTRKKILFKNGSDLSYQYLVLSAGSETEYFGIPGLKENSIPLKTIEDALEIRRKIIELCHLAGEKKIDRKLNFVIGGGGFTGVELASEMIFFIKRLAPRHGMSAQHKEITILEATNQILPGIDPKISNLALKKLQSLGVKINLDSLVVSVKDKRVTLKNGQVINSDLIIWTGGIKANKLLSQIPGLELDKKGRCAVNEHLQIKGLQNEFAIGDNALCLDPKTNEALPPTAQIAEQQAVTVAHNIVNSIEGRPMEKFSAHFWGFIVPVGGRYAIAALKFGTFTGLLGYVLRKLVDLNYFRQIMPLKKAMQTWLQGTMIYRHND